MVLGHYTLMPLYHYTVIPLYRYTYVTLCHCAVVAIYPGTFQAKRKIPEKKLLALHKIKQKG
jgi:hypothetical protein